MGKTPPPRVPPGAMRQLGLFVGFTRATSDLIRLSGADIWVRSNGVTNLETPVAFSEPLEAAYMLSPDKIAAAIRDLAAY